MSQFDIEHRSKSSTLNPEIRQAELSITEPFIPNADKVKEKIESLNIKQNPKKKRKCLRSTTASFFERKKLSTDENIVDRNISIQQLINERHKFENKTRTFENHWTYICHKMILDKRKSKYEEEQQKHRKQIIQQNKSFKSFVLSQMNEINKNTKKKKLQKRQSVLNHRVSKSIALRSLNQEKQKNGEEVRKQEWQIHEKISKFKEKTRRDNKKKYCKVKVSEEFFEEEKKKRLAQKKRIAIENFNLRWIKQFEQKESIKKEASLRKRFFSQKMQKILQKSRI